MIRVESKQDLKGYTEFEECILFDEDDPDFDHHLPAIPETYLVQAWSEKDVHPEDNIRKASRYWGYDSEEQLIQVADELFENGRYIEVYELLNRIKFTHMSNVRWRVSRVLFKMASDKKLPLNIRSDMIYEAYLLMKEVINLGIEDANIYKWMAIILDAKAGIEGTDKRVKSFGKIKTYLLKSYELNPNDVVVLYMLGKWCFEMSHLSWFQRLVARVLFSAPPKASYQEAYTYLLKASEAEEKCYYIPCFYTLGKTCMHLKQYFRARYYLQHAFNLPARTETESECATKAKKLFSLLDQYDVCSEDLFQS